MRSRKSRKQVKSETKEKKHKTNLKIIIPIIGALIILALVLFTSPQGSDSWTVDKNGLLSYPENRGKLDVKVLKTESGKDYIRETISFASKDYTVEGILRIPLSEKKVPAIVILPGATVSKEGTQGLAEILSSMGYASLGIEQRNRGAVNFRYDYELFRNGEEPIQHKMVFDALRAVDVLKRDEHIDAERIALLGESNGGRFAIIATAIDPSIRGVIAISTSGYNTQAQLINIKDETLIRFYRSIDPDTYLGMIPPRKLVMLHSVNDSIIPIELAQATFEKAREPKQFYRITTGTHGFDESMRQPLKKELSQMFQ
jgi:dienelactone hydrolase